jgi:hypothetical protein
MTPSSRARDDAYPEMPRGRERAVELPTDIRRCRAGRRRRYADRMERALWLEQMRYVQPKTAFSRFPRVHRADFEVHKGSVRPVRHSPGNNRYLRIPAVHCSVFQLITPPRRGRSRLECAEQIRDCLAAHADAPAPRARWYVLLSARPALTADCASSVRAKLSEATAKQKFGSGKFR